MSSVFTPPRRRRIVFGSLPSLVAVALLAAAPAVAAQGDALAQVITPLPAGMAPKIDHTKGPVTGERLGPILPWTGLYSDPAQSGSGLSVDMGLEGMMFMTFGTFDSQGRQENLLAQPLYKPTSNLERHETGVTGRATAEFFRVRNGQTPGGAWREPDYEATGLVAEFEWVAPRRATMTFGGHTYHWQANNYDGRNDGAFMEGRWAATRVQDSAPWYNPHDEGGWDKPFIAGSAVILDIKRLDVAPSSFVPKDDHVVFDAELHMPKEGDELYLMTCAPPLGGQRHNSKVWCDRVLSAFGGFGGALGWETAQRVLLWYNPETGLAFGSGLEGKTGLRGLTPRTVNVYIEPNQVRVRTGRLAQWHSTMLSDGLYLTRLPDKTEISDPDMSLEGGCTNCD